MIRTWIIETTTTTIVAARDGEGGKGKGCYLARGTGNPWSEWLNATS